LSGADLRWIHEPAGAHFEPLMYDLAALAVVAACFAFAFVVLHVLGRV
jgi:hypothetical protein